MEKRKEHLKFLIMDHSLKVKESDIDALSLQTEIIRRNIQNMGNNKLIDAYAPIFTHFQRGEDQ